MDIDQIPHYQDEENLYANPLNQKLRIYETYRGYMKQTKNKLADSKNLIMQKDPNNNFLYFITNPLYILNTNTYEIINRTAYADKIRIEDNKILSFQALNQYFTVLYDRHTIFIFPLSTNINISSEHRLNFLKDNEVIVKIHHINTEINNPYFIVVSSISKIYILKLTIDNNLRISYTFEEFSEKSTLFSKLWSNFTTPQTISKIYTLNPFCYTKYIRNNKKNNALFLLNENYIKKLEFNVSNKGVESELAFQINILSYFYESLKPANIKNISIDSADILFDKIKKQIKIYVILKNTTLITQAEYYLYQIVINNDTNQIVSFEQIINFSSQFEQMNKNITNFSYITANKYREEAYIVFSQLRGSLVCYFLDDPKDLRYQYVDYEVRGINVINNAETFNIELLSLDQGVWEVQCRDNVFFMNDKTTQFTFNVITNPTYNEGMNENTNDRFQRLFTQEIPMLDRNSQIDKIFNDAINKYFNINEQLLTDEDRDAEIYNFEQKLKGFDFNLIYNAIHKILISRMDDESLNVDIINKDSAKVEGVIIEYLYKKEKILDFIYNFLVFYRVFQNFDIRRSIFMNYLSFREKLTVAIKLREIENEVIENKLKLQPDENNKRINVNINTLALSLFERLFRNLKSNYTQNYPENINKPFTKIQIYSKISRIDIYLRYLFDAYNSIFIDYKVNKDEKLIISYFLVVIWNKIISEIETIHNTYNSVISFSFRDINVFKEHIEYSWLLNIEFLENLKNIYYNFLEVYLKSSYHFDYLKNDVLSYVENILYLFDCYYKSNHSSDNQKIYFQIKKDMIGKIINVNPEKSLKIANRFRDFYSVTLICYTNSWIEKLKKIMEENNEEKEVIIYILKLYLLLESDTTKSDKKFNEFSYFDNFHEYMIEIKEIVIRYPKLNFFYELFMKSKNNLEYSESDIKIDDLIRKIIDKRNIEIFLRISKVINSLNDCNYEDFLIRDNVVEFVDSFKTTNENNSKEINFCILINYLKNSFKLSEDPKLNIFENFEIILNQFLDRELDSKYRIALQLVQIAKEINYNFDMRLFDRLSEVIIRRALVDEYNLLDLNMADLNINATNIDSLSDEQKRELFSKSLIGDLNRYINITGVISEIFAQGDMAGSFSGSRRVNQNDYIEFIRIILSN